MRPLTERLSPVIKAFVIANSLLYAAYALVPQIQFVINEHVALSTRAITSLQVWQPVTALFVHVDFLSFAFNLIGLWFVAATIERSSGTRKFLLLFFVVGVVSNVVKVLVSFWMGSPQIFAGPGTAILGLFVAFGVQYGSAQARVLGGLVLKAQTLATILVGFSLFVALTQGAWAHFAGDVVGVVLAFFIMGGRVGAARDLFSGWRAKRTRRRYQVIDGGRGRERGRDADGPPFLN